MDEAKPLDAHQNLEEVISSLPPPLFHFDVEGVGMTLPSPLSVDMERMSWFTSMPELSEMEGKVATTLLPGMHWAAAPPPSTLSGMGGVPPPPPPMGSLSPGAVQS